MGGKGVGVGKHEKLTTRMKDVMVDLETLGKRPGCPILSIGAVYFDPLTGELGPEMYEVVNLESCMKLGLVVDPETEKWWSEQSEEARLVLELASVNKGSYSPKKRGGTGRGITAPPNVGLGRGLDIFAEFCGLAGKKEVKVWGNGSDFDNAILAHCFHLAKRELPWEFWNNRCFRTLKALSPLKMERSGTHHNALDDAKTQALHAVKVYADLAAKKTATTKRRGV